MNATPRIVYLSVFAALVVVIALGNTANAGSINFDDLLVDGGFEFIRADHYRNKGIVFDASIPVENLPVPEPNFAPTFSATGGTLPNALSLSPTIGPLSIDFMFAASGTSTPMVTDFIQVTAWDAEAGFSIATLQAFDVNNQILGTDTAATPAGGGSAFLSISDPGIARVRLSQDADGGLLPTYRSSTPFPSLIVMAGLTRKISTLC